MKILTTLVLFISLFVVQKITGQTQTITATVVNATSDTGKVSFALYDKKTFLTKPIQAKSSTIKGGKSLVVFENVPSGEYAIVCFHDKNDNNKMDFEPNGMPKEDYGASNNAMNFGPPQYEQAKFSVTNKNVSLEIKF